MELIGGLDGKRVPAENLKLSPLERGGRHDYGEIVRARGSKSVVLILGDQEEITSTDVEAASLYCCRLSQIVPRIKCGLASPGLSAIADR